MIILIIINLWIHVSENVPFSSKRRKAACLKACRRQALLERAKYYNLKQNEAQNACAESANKGVN